jgi:nitroreductase
MQVDTAIKRRHSVRRYSSRGVNWDRIVEVLDSATYAPFAGNLCTLRLILVSDKQKIQQVADAARQDFIVKAPVLIVVCSDPEIAVNAYNTRGHRYSRQQAGAAIQNMLLKITDLGFASCWIGAFDDNMIKGILGIPENVEVEAILPLAHKSVIREMKKSKIPLHNILYFEHYGRKQRILPKMTK